MNADKIVLFDRLYAQYKKDIDEKTKKISVLESQLAFDRRDQRKGSMRDIDETQPDQAELDRLKSQLKS